jgi:acetyl/propionyl-CoA carboxylase alpha subunit
MVAQGDKLEVAQKEIKQKGSAIECRIYAEDPDNNFMPSIGLIEKIGAPTLRDVRLDCGFLDGTEVGVNYDPMLAKLIVWGETRELAIEKSIKSLDEVLFLGVKTNRDYLKRILGHKDFIKGNTHTHFIPDHAGELKPRELTTADKAKLLAGFILGGKKAVTQTTLGGAGFTPWTTLTGFRN